MTIHHTQRRAAETLGLELDDEGDGVTGTTGNVTIEAETARAVLDAARAVLPLASANDDLTFEFSADRWAITSEGGDEIFEGASLEGASDAIAAYIAEQEADEADDEDTGGHNIVPEKYRQAYAASPVKGTCGDWLAEQIARLVGQDISAFAGLLAQNDVYPSVKTEGRGWQGRYRMTGRMMLETKLLATGILEASPGRVVAPPAWIEERRAIRSARRAS